MSYRQTHCASIAKQLKNGHEAAGTLSTVDQTLIARQATIKGFSMVILHLIEHLYAAYISRFVYTYTYRIYSYAHHLFVSYHPIAPTSSPSAVKSRCFGRHRFRRLSSSKPFQGPEVTCLAAKRMQGPGTACTMSCLGEKKSQGSSELQS